MTDLPAAIAALRAECDANASIGHEPVSWFLVDAALAALDAAQPVAWLYTLEYGPSVVNRMASDRQLNYPFGVCGADYQRANGEGVSYVRESPLYLAPQAPPAAVPAGYVSMPVGRVQHVIDLLAERAHLNNARSPAHNARLLLEATLTTAKENGNG